MIIYLTSPEIPCFLSNITVLRNPIIGPICTTIQSIYFDRESDGSKYDAMDGINKRVEQIGKKNLYYPALCIFPEGTTNNGEFLMEFKKGGFVNEYHPITISSLRWSSQVNPCLNMTDLLTNFVFNMSNWGAELTIAEFEPFDPMYSIEKRGLQPNDEENWKYILEDVYYLYEYAFNLPSSHDTFRDKKALKQSLNLTFK